MKKFICEVCNKEFDNEKSLKCHKAVHYRKKELVKKVDNTEYNNKCKKCGKTFKTWQALSGHMAYCNGEMKECPICKKSVYAMRFNKHYEKCLEREEYFSDKIENIDYVVCKICGCKKLSLKKHLESHNICAKQYKNKYNSPIECEKSEKKAKESYNKRYGIDSRGSAFPHDSKNKCEELIDNITPDNVIFSDRKYYVALKNKEWVKNPDFIVVENDKVNDYKKDIEKNGFLKDRNLKKSIKKVIEHFGDYWHGECKTGIKNDLHEKQIIENYKKVGIDCLVIWEHELKDIDSLKIKINNFLDK